METLDGADLGEYQKRQSFAQFLAERLVSRFAGKEAARISGVKPSRGSVFIGTLLPRSDIQRRSPERASPSEMGVTVLVPPDSGPDESLEITVSGAFYYRVFPTLDEQLDAREKKASLDANDLEDEHTQELPEGLLRRVWKKAGPFELKVEVPLSDLPGKGECVLAEGEGIAEDALKEWSQDHDRFRSRKFTSKRYVDQLEELIVPTSATTDESSFSEYLRDWFNGSIPKPSWSTKVSLRVRPYREGYRRVAVVLENMVVEERSRDDVDNAIFESEVIVEAVGFSFARFVLQRLRDDYRHSGEIPGIGTNCVAEAESMEPLTRVWSGHAPVFFQPRLHPKVFDANLEDLASDPSPHLEQLQEGMRVQVSKLRGEFAKMEASLSPQGRMFFERDVQLSESELRRFSEGIRALKELPAALEAFKLTNATFSQSRKGFSTWYRFQMAFLVCLIPDLVSPRFPEFEHHRDSVDVIYFPTGGGKTEAYLATVVFQMFFDRLMGKRSGVSAITRFPLRLLSLQQIQRIADIFGSAEKIRRQHEVIGQPGYDSFSTGYFVGSANTPNRLYYPGYEGRGEIDEISPLIQDSRRGDRYKILERCPFCGAKSIEVVGDLAAVRIRLVCSDCSETLPIFISDDEIYRYLPTFVIGTLDKMASAGWRYHFRHLFGQVTHRCPDHGYLSGGRCLYGGANNLCNREPAEYSPVFLDDPTPSILIQDEMHLVRESLGCYDSHYETFLDRLELELTKGTKRLKIITATATISNTDTHLYHLYSRRGAEFPSRGPNPSESFYYEEDPQKIARIVVGVMPHNKTMLHAVLDILHQHAREIRNWRRDPSELIVRGIFASYEEALEAITDYSVAISYNLMKMQGDAVSHSVRTMINPQLRKEGLGEINAQAMTGDVTFEQVRRVLGALETRQTAGGVDLITATSMISHGVDINSLNFMAFQGMPSSTAEYIQAYSRVGRRYPGIVFVVFNQARERDGSHYKYFHNYHHLSNLLIEPVPINRWAKFSIDRTLPGIFCASIMTYFEPLVQTMGHRRLYMTDDFADAINKGLVTEDQILDFILNSYYVADSDMGGHFANVIRTKVREYMGELTAPGTNRFIAMALSDKPLTNLRDTDVQIEISRTPESYEPMERVTAPPPGGEKG